jgi:hypothetical protein
MEKCQFRFRFRGSENKKSAIIWAFIWSLSMRSFRKSATSPTNEIRTKNLAEIRIWASQCLQEDFQLLQFPKFDQTKQPTDQCRCLWCGASFDSHKCRDLHGIAGTESSIQIRPQSISAPATPVRDSIVAVPKFSPNADNFYQEYQCELYWFSLPIDFNARSIDSTNKLRAKLYFKITVQIVHSLRM